MIPGMQSAILSATVAPRPLRELLLGPESQAIAVPVGALRARLRVICFGQSGSYEEDEENPNVFTIPGHGGDYVGVNAANVVGLATLYIQAGAGFLAVRATDVAGTILARAFNDGSTVASGTGDTRTNGQAGTDGGFAGQARGGAAAGPNGVGVAPAGAAGAEPIGAAGAGNNYGGGGGCGVTGGGSLANPRPGAPGWIEIVWYFDLGDVGADGDEGDIVEGGDYPDPPSGGGEGALDFSDPDNSGLITLM